MQGLTLFHVRTFPRPLWRNSPGRAQRNRTIIASVNSDLKHSTKKQIFPLLSIAYLACIPANSWSGEFQPPQEIHEVASQFLQSTVDKNGNRNRVQIGEIDSRLRLPRCTSSLVPFMPPGVDPKGNITVGIRCSEPKSWKLYISARVTTYDNVVVLTRSLPRHSMITSEDVRLVEYDVTDVTSPLLTRVEEAIGKELSRSLPGDRPLTYNVLSNPVVIRRGQRVSLLYKSPGIEVRGSGLALGDGTKGQRIAVRPHGVSRTVTGVVLRPGVILVNQN